MSVLVTGGAGFIGANFVRELLAAEPDTRVVVVDKLTYAGSIEAMDELATEPRFTFVRADIGDKWALRDVLAKHQPDGIVHFAAETHVDRSIDAPADFMQTNVMGTFALLEECRRYTREFRFVHVSTDEVFGALGLEDPPFVETTPYDPRSPYSASKASSDHLVSAYVHTYGFPALTTNCSNNYGPYQYPEKLIPLIVARALANETLPVYGKGENVRDWIYVADHCEAVRTVLRGGRIGQTYLIGGRSEQQNLQVVHQICDLLDELMPRERKYRELISFVTDRPGHDFRYAIDPSKLEQELGWRPRTSFAEGLRKTIAWFVEHRAWAAARSKTYARAIT